MKPSLRRRIRRLLGCLLVVALALATLGCVRAASRDTRTAPSDAQLQHLVDRWRERAGAPAVTMAVTTPSRRFLAASGTPERGRGAPVSPGARFRVASVTKMFVATVVLQLVEEGRLGLDDPLADHVPGVANGDGVTIRQLLNHTSGIPDYARTEGYKKRILARRDRRWSAEEVLDLVAGVRRDFAPGTDYSYSNTGYVLLGQVIEQVTGSTWAAEVRRRIIDPLRLRDTYVSGAEPVPGRFVPGYFDGNEDGHEEEIDAGRPWPSVETLEGAAGALLSTAGDLATFAQALFGGRLLRPATLRQMLTEGPHRMRTAGYGLGVEILRPDYRLTVWGHGGFGIGYRAVVFYVPGNNLTVVVLANDAKANVPDLAELVVRAELASHRP